MKKTIFSALVLLIVLQMLFTPVFAADNSMSFDYNLTVDGQDTREVKTGDIITVVLKLRRTDASDSYPMYAMQDEIRYDSTFFELVEGSTVLNTGIVSTDIAMVDQYREFYMNYLSMSGGTTWDPDMLIGTFQLKVIGQQGVTKITNQDYLVSAQDGTDCYLSRANDVTIILSTDCVVTFMTNGGSEIADQIVQYGEKIVPPKDPVREGYIFDGWYQDIHLTEKWDFDSDVVQGNMSLYAKWSPAATADSAPVTSDISHGWPWWGLLLLIVLLLLWVVKQNRAASKKTKQ